MRRNMSGNLGLYKYLWPGSVLTLPRKILESIEVASATYRCELSDNQVVSLVSVKVKSREGNLDDFVLSTSCRRAKNPLWTEISQEV